MDDKWMDGQKNRSMSILYNCVTTVLHSYIYDTRIYVLQASSIRCYVFIFFYIYFFYLGHKSLL